MLKRHAIQVLRQAGHTLDEIAAFVAVSRSSVQRVLDEPPVSHDNTELERTARHVGRPSKESIWGQGVPGPNWQIK